MKITYTRWLSFLFSLLLAPSISQAQAFISDPTHVYKIVSRTNGDVLEIGGGNRYESGHWVNGWGYWGGANQQWQFQSRPGGYFTITNRNSNYFLSTNLNGGNRGDGIIAYQVDTYTPSNYGQDWELVPVTYHISPVTNHYYYKLKSRLSGKVLEYVDPNKRSQFGLSTGNNVWQWSETADNDPNRHPYIVNQEFDIIDVSANSLVQPIRSVFKIVNNSTGKLLSSTAEDRGVSQESFRNLAGQEWTFTDYNSDGYLFIVNRKDNTVLEMGGGGDVGVNGRRANLWDYAGNYAQQWALLDIYDSHVLTLAEATDGRVLKIYNRYSGKVLEISNGNTGEREPAQQWNDYSLPWQQWTIQFQSDNLTSPYPKEPLLTSARTSVSTSDGPASSTVQGLSLYPNPARNELSIAVDGQTETVTVRITDVQGKLTTARYMGNGKVDVSELAIGLYVLSASDGKHEYHQKFVKE